ncbi:MULTISPECIES: hypothetical protein [Paenibacillus]|nr:MULTISPECIES: hypothetical protein [Paenibacillus]
MLTFIPLALLVIFVASQWISWAAAKRKALSSSDIDLEFMNRLNNGEKP